MAEPASPLLHVIVQYCNDANPARQAEYDECVRRNLNNKQVIAVHNLVEPNTRVPEAISSHPKYRERSHPHWLTFADALAYANGALPGEIAALVNLDIFLGDDGVIWSDCRSMLEAGMVLALARLEWDGNGKWHEDPGLQSAMFCTAQDGWVLKTPITVSDCDFEMGLLGCDNAFAARIKNSGYLPINWHTRFPIFHNDSVRGKSDANSDIVHAAEAGRRPRNKHPEHAEQLLLPSVDGLKGLDDLTNWLGMPDTERYKLICEILSRYRTVTNATPPK